MYFYQAYFLKTRWHHQKPSSLMKVSNLPVCGVLQKKKMGPHKVVLECTEYKYMEYHTHKIQTLTFIVLISLFIILHKVKAVQWGDKLCPFWLGLTFPRTGGRDGSKRSASDVAMKHVGMGPSHHPKESTVLGKPGHNPQLTQTQQQSPLCLPLCSGSIYVTGAERALGENNS